MRLILLFGLLTALGCRQDPRYPDGKPAEYEDSVPTDDADGDGYGIDDDCDDGDASTNPGAEETPYDGVDNDCDDSTPDDDLDGDGFELDEDCDDLDATTYPGAEDPCDGVDNDCDGTVDNGEASTTWYSDADGDGYGDDATATSGCEPPKGAVFEGGDCDDADPAYHPGATEDDCTDPADYNCDGSVGYDDHDGDGWPACEDCDDFQDDVNPDATETCNERDDDCDAVVDEDDAIDASSWYTDGDGDGYGGGTTIIACDQPAGTAAYDGDCDDADAAYYPGAPEACTDTVDYSCDGSIGYVDADGDGYAACEECDDSDATSNPGGTEVCDGADNDCDGVVDDGATDALTWYLDGDRDGYGGSTTTVACAQPVGHVADGGDCDDADRAVNPSATEVCDGADNDCDGTADGADAYGSTDWYPDADGDGYGDPSGGVTDCSAPAGHVDNGADCDDGDGGVYPGADEHCDALDEDCDGSVDEDAVDASTWYTDADGDGYGDAATVSCSAPSDGISTGGDCDDTDLSINPAATDTCDYVDNDCSGVVDDPYRSGTKYVLDTDCGSCGNDCSTYSFDNASSACDTSLVTPACDYTCDAGWYDVNGSGLDGCECEYLSSTDEPFDGVDADCDGTDGAPTEGVYVSASTGSAAGAGTLDDPLDSVQDGIDLADASGLAYVLVAEGTYAENVELLDGVTLRGGFDSAFTLQDPATYLTTLEGQGSTSSTPATLVARSISGGAAVEGFTIVGNAGSGRGQSAIAVWIEDCTDALELRDNVIEARSARDGADGSTGPDGSDGGSGVDGTAGTTTSTSCATLTSGGAGGTNTCDGTATDGGDGGGTDCPSFGSYQQEGVDGLPAGGAGGSTGCDGDIDTSPDCGTCSVDTCWDEGGDGSNGADGSGGAGGTGASDADGSAGTSGWSGGSGADGAAGDYGHGGGGGGSGSGAEVDSACASTQHLGGAGGGGGAGGCGGDGGDAGEGGGGSIGVILVYTTAVSSLPVLEDNTITAGNGGYGGDGGDGGAGGLGGFGGYGGTRDTSSAWCGQAGGNGGEGGLGGAGGGGGGGAGGVSLAVAAFGVTPSSTWASADNTLAYGSAGAGGRGGLSGGAGGSDGADGVDGDEGAQNW